MNQSKKKEKLQMKNFMKKIARSRLFAVVLAIVLIASVATVAMAAEEETGDTKEGKE